MGQIKLADVVSNLELNIRWICDNPAHRFPGYGNVEMAMRDALELLKEYDSDERLKAKEAIHIHEESPEHDWRTDDNGNIDEFGLDYGVHNGPVCKRCYYSFCMHCKPNGWNDEPCIIDYYECPTCGKRMSKGKAFCEYCGQAVKWE